MKLRRGALKDLVMLALIDAVLLIGAGTGYEQHPVASMCSTFVAGAVTLFAVLIWESER